MEKQIREEVTFTDGKVIVRGKMHARGERKRADYILYYKNNFDGYTSFYTNNNSYFFFNNFT